MSNRILSRQLAKIFCTASLGLGCLTSPYASAFEPFVVRDIRVDGIQRTEAGTVFSYLPVHVGDTMTDEKAAEAIKALFATGFFKDVRLEVEKDVLVVLVEERPAIAAVDFVGAKEFDKDVLKRALKEIGVAESRIFDRSSLERAEQELKRQYLSHGKYGLRITTTVTPLERNRVAISFKLDEGQIAKIQGINFVGNQAFKESVLVDQMKLATPGWMSWFTKSDQYSRQKLSGDLETLRSFYLDRGYMEFQIDSTQVSISADKKEVFLTINITEGEKFTISDVKLAGDLLGREQELTALIKIKRGEAYSGTQMNETLKAITDRLGAFGYAFANANAAPDIDRDKHQVAFTIFVDPGRRVYVRQVNVIGNSRTRDVVIRREMRQFESSWYDAEKVTQSRDRVDRLGYFKEVAIETPPVTGVTDQVDVNVRVEEKPTGSFTLGAGFSSSEKVILTTGIQEQNIFGSGKSLALNVNTSKANTTYVLSHGDPYFTEDGVSRSTDLAFRKTQGGPLGLGTFVVKTSKLGVRFGVPTSDYDRMSYGLAYEGTDLQLDSTSPLNYQTYASEFGNKSNALVASVGWSRDTRDSGLAPSKGRFSRADLDVTVPAGDLRYARATYQDQYYYKVSRDYTIAFNGEIDYGKGFGGKPYPIFKNFFAGGIGSVRGYKDATLGPRDANGNPTGGASRLFGNVEFLMPMPGLGSDRTVRLFGFFDGGNVYAEGQKIQLSDLRYSVGFGVNWLSPMGPFKLSFGHALNRKEPEQAQSLQFTFGTGF